MPVRERVGLQGLGPHGDAVARYGWYLVVSIPHDHRGDEVLMEVVDILHQPVLQRGADGDIVEDLQMLHVLTQPDAAGVRADRDTELGREQQY